MSPAVAKSAKSAKAPTETIRLTKLKLLDNDSDSDDGDTAAESSGFRVNEEFARRFEHNKKREEKHKLEEKYKKNSARRNDDDSDDSSSSNETEDDDGFLATEALDAQISATLQAIRNKDPRVYDKDITFYESRDDDTVTPAKEKKEKPVFLKDYHREKLLRGDVGASDDEDEDAPRTYAQEQDALKKSIVSEFHASSSGDESDENSDEDGFMKRKEPAKPKADAQGVHHSRSESVKTVQLDVANANKDPENFLSNFMSARAWIPQDGSKWEAFESDDGEDDGRADEFEEAYNLRFENPEKSNEVLKSYARDFAAARSVRREETGGRKRQREAERERKEAEKQERKDKKARLRKLKLDETEKRLQKIKEAAGAMGKTLTDEEWMQFLDEAWENDKWEEEMQKRYGDEYYAVGDDAAAHLDDDQEADNDKAEEKKKKRPIKPTWDEDIDIKDLVPDFEDEEAEPSTTLGDLEDKDSEAGDDQEEDSRPSKKRKKGDHKQERIEKQKKARQERSKLEALVDSKIELAHHDLLDSKSGDVAPISTGSSSISNTGGFRYRETSPQSFGMTARDILLAPSDQALNDYVGLKKLATFRDAEKKRKDKKHFGKKARLRNWRRDVFGREYEREGPTYGFERLAEVEGNRVDGNKLKKKKNKDEGVQSAAQKENGGDDVIGEAGKARKKRKRSKGSNAAGGEVEA